MDPFQRLVASPFDIDVVCVYSNSIHMVYYPPLVEGWRRDRRLSCRQRPRHKSPRRTSHRPPTHGQRRAKSRTTLCVDGIGRRISIDRWAGTLWGGGGGVLNIKRGKLPRRLNDDRSVAAAAAPPRQRRSKEIGGICVAACLLCYAWGRLL
jgi:hypothetical protein